MSENHNLSLSNLYFEQELNSQMKSYMIIETKHNDNYNKGAENVEEVNSLNNDESSIEEQEEPRQNRRVRR